MQSIQELTRDMASGIRFVCTDIDDTLTKNGKLSGEAYQSLWRLFSSGIHVIPVTGRPAGWCDLIVRQWPVEGIVGENGAFAFFLENGRLRQMYHPSVAFGDVKKKLEIVRQSVLSEIPGTRVAKDQFSRMFDLAIDFREEPPDLGYETAVKIAELCERHGARAMISSIHVNAWYGDYNKVKMLSHYLKARWSIDDQEQKTQVFYCGDSPNDEPMFRRFPLSCGVANIRETEHLITHTPAFICSEPFGEGFSEFAAVLLSRKSGDFHARA